MRLGLALLLALPAVASAQPQLQISSTSDCPSAEAVRAELDKGATDLSGSTFKDEVSIADTGSHFTVTVGESERGFRAFADGWRKCGERAKQAAAFIAQTLRGERGITESTSAFLSESQAQNPIAKPEPFAEERREADQPSKFIGIGRMTPTEAVQRLLPGDLKFELHGYLRAPMRLSWDYPHGSSSGSGGMASTMTGGQTASGSLRVRSPWLLDDDYFRSGFAYTRLQEQDYAELFLSVGNRYLTGTVALMGSLYSDWAKPLLDHQFGIAQGWLTFNWQAEGPRLRFRLRIKGGAFWDRFGYMPEYDTYMFGRTHQMGAQTRFEFAHKNLSLWLVQGTGAHLDDIQANQGLTLLNYLALGVAWKDLVEAGFYFFDTQTHDKRQLKDITDASMRVYGLETRINTRRFGRAYLAGSVIPLDKAVSLSPVLEVVHGFGGRGITENYLGLEKSDNGTGRLWNVGFSYRYSLRSLLSVVAPERLHPLHGGDVTLGFFGMYTYVESKQKDPDKTINKDGIGYFKWGVEGGWAALSWLALSLRYDRVIMNLDDDASSFRIITPRISLRTHWLVDAEIYLQFSKYFYGSRVQLRPQQVPLETVPDDNVFKIQAQIAF